MLKMKTLRDNGPVYEFKSIICDGLLTLKYLKSLFLDKRIYEKNPDSQQIFCA